MQYADIAIAAPALNTFTYRVPDELSDKICKGTRVEVSFRRRRAIGYVVGVSDESPAGLDAERIKKIEDIMDDGPIFSKEMLKWLRWISQYYCAPLGEVFRTALPSRMNQVNPPKTSRPILPREMECVKQASNLQLTEDQSAALDEIEKGLGQEIFKPVLLHGITGSGKTEIYLRLFEHVEASGGQAIMLVPEIGLTPQLTLNLVERFGDGVAIYHSGLTDAQRHHQWKRMLKGEPSVVVGTRSALFAPLALFPQ